MQIKFFHSSVTLTKGFGCFWNAFGGVLVGGEAGEPGEAADVADGGQPRVEQPGLQLPPRLLPSLPLNPRPAGCHPGDEGQCQKVKFPANPGNPDNPGITGGVKARTCLANHRPQEIQL